MSSKPWLIAAALFSFSAPAFAETQALPADACATAWQTVCDAPNFEKNPDELPARKVYLELLRSKQIERGLEEKFQAALRANNDPILDVSNQKTMAALQELFRTKGKRGLHDYIDAFVIRRFVSPAFSNDFAAIVGKHLRVRVEDECPYDSYCEPVNLLSREKATQLRKEIENISSKSLDRIHEMAFDAFTPDAYLQLAKGLLSNVRFNFLEKPITSEKAFEIELSKKVSVVFTQELRDGVHAEFKAVLEGTKQLIPWLDLKEPPRLTVGEGLDYSSNADTVYTYNIVHGITVRKAFYMHSPYTFIHLSYGLIHDPKARIFSVLAHELMHYLSWNHLLSSDESAIKCIGTASSVAAKEYQVTETLADLFAAELLAWRIQQLNLSPADRRSAVLNGSMFYCSESKDYDNRNEHLRSDLRTNRIFLAHPYLRSVLGCPTESAPKYCGPPWSNDSP
jgi:hypothetical protein